MCPANPSRVRCACSYDHPDFGCSSDVEDSDAAYIQALLYVLNGTDTYALNAMKVRGLRAGKVWGGGGPVLAMQAGPTRAGVVGGGGEFLLGPVLVALPGPGPPCS